MEFFRPDPTEIIVTPISKLRLRFPSQRLDRKERAMRPGIAASRLVMMPASRIHPAPYQERRADEQAVTSARGSHGIGGAKSGDAPA